MSDILKEFYLVKDQLPPSAALTYAEYMAEEIERLNGEVEALLETVESTAVCRNHTWEITAFDGCVICEIERLRSVVDAVKAYINNRPKGFNDLVDALRELEDSNE